MTVDWLTRPEQLEPIAADWTQLESRVHDRTHLSTCDFLTTWYRHYAGEYGGAPLVGVARSDGRVVGIAPLTVRRGTIGKIPVTRVEFAPTDVPAGEFLVEDDRPEIVRHFLDALVRERRFDVISLDGFAPASGQLAALRDGAQSHRMSIELDDHAFAIVDLRHGYPAYYATLKGVERRKLNQKARKIDTAGAAIDGIMLGEGAETTAESTARMIAITEASYKLAGQRLADHHRNFLSELIERLARRHVLWMPILSIGGRDAAFILGLVERGSFYDITLAYNETFAKVSPGSYLMQRTLEQLAGLGVHTAVSHGAHEYKKYWASAFVPQKRVFLFAPTVRASATRFVRFGLQPLWRRLGHSAQPPEDIPVAS